MQEHFELTQMIWLAFSWNQTLWLCRKDPFPHGKLTISGGPCHWGIWSAKLLDSYRKLRFLQNTIVQINVQDPWLADER